MTKNIFEKKIKSLKIAFFDFDGVFTDNLVSVSEEGVESVSCCRSDGIGLSRINSIGIKSFVISTEKNPVVQVRCKKLKISCFQGVDNKEIAILEICKKLKVSVEECLFLGNDINDITALKLVGLPIAVADAYPEILDYVIYKTKAKGGTGAVREICDIIFNFNKVS